MQLGVIADSHVVVGERAGESATWHNDFRLSDSCERFAAAMTHPHLRDADALVVLGDLVHFGDRASLRAVVDIAAACARPVVLLSGNHDVLDPGVRLEDVVGETTAPPSQVWSPRVDTPPAVVCGLFEPAGIGLQVVEVGGMWVTPNLPFAVESRGVVDAPPGAPGVTLTHFPLRDFQRRCEDAGFLYSGHLSQLATAPALDRGWVPHVVLNGHLHVRAVETAGCTLQLSFAALVEAPYEIATLDLERRGRGLDIEYDCVSVRAVPEARLPTLDGARRSWTEFTGASRPVAPPGGR
jgi:hypothetical protein